MASVSLPIAFLTFFVAASVIWSDEPILSARRAYGLVGLTIFCHWVRVRFTLTEVTRIVFYTGLLAAIASLVLVLIAPSTFIHQTFYPGAWHGIFSEKNALGESMCFTIVSSVPLIMAAKARARIGFVAASGLCAFLLVKSQSVSAALVLTAVISSFVAIVLSKRGVQGRIAVALSVGLAAIALIALASGGATADSAFDLLGRDSSLTGRGPIWEAVGHAISAKPMLGYGYSSFWRPDGDWTSYVDEDWRVYHAHNGFLELTLDAGLIGCAIFICIFVVTYAKTVRAVITRPTIEAAWPYLVMTYFILVNFDESSIAKYNNLNWCVYVIATLFAANARPFKVTAARTTVHRPSIRRRNDQ